MKLRKLEYKDAPLMLEWMHDPDTKKYFRKSMESQTLEETLLFIENARNSFEEGSTLHFAVVDSNDQYLGTISLKNINKEDGNAEYAVSMGRRGRGNGIAKEATWEILSYAFNKLGLERVFLNVLEDNIRAQKLYEKCGFKFEGEFRKCLLKDGKYKNLKWYSILKEEFNMVCDTR